MSAAEIEVEDVLHEEPEGDCFGYFKIKEASGNRLQIVGWAFAEGQAVRAVEVLAEESVVATAVPAVPRPDVAELFPQTPASLVSGFEVEIEADGHGRSELAVVAVMENEERHSLGSLTLGVRPPSGPRSPWGGEGA